MDKNELMQTVGRNLQRIRLERGYTQEELSEMAGISTSFYANMERGKKGVSIFVLRELADALQTSTDSLLYSDQSAGQLHNIETLLSDVPDSFVAAMERMIRLCKKEFAGEPSVCK